MIDKRDYYLLHYGTDNEMQIYFQRDGLSRDLSKLLVGKYSEFVKTVINGFYIDKEIYLQKDIEKAMAKALRVLKEKME